MNKKPTMTRRQRIRTLVRLSIIGLLIVGLLALGSYLLSLFGLDNLTQEQIRQIVDGFGVWAPLAFVFITFLQVTFVPIPFVVSILAGNLLFGFWGAFFYSLIGSVAGSLFAYSLGKWIGRPFVNWAFGDEDVVNHYLMKTQGKEFVVFFFMFLLPFFPDDALCALAGITALNRKQFYFIQLTARPTTILGNLLLWTGKLSFNSIYGLIVMALLIIFSAVAFYFSFKHADLINRYFNRFMDFLSMKRRTAVNHYLHSLRLHTSRKVRKVLALIARRIHPVTAWLSRVFAPVIRIVKQTHAAVRSYVSRVVERLKNRIEQRLVEANEKKAKRNAEQNGEDGSDVPTDEPTASLEENVITDEPAAPRDAQPSDAPHAEHDLHTV